MATPDPLSVLLGRQSERTELDRLVNALSSAPPEGLAAAVSV
jgi:hypothetical protein